MGVMLTAIVAAVALAVVAGIGFMFIQRPVYEAQPMPSVRIGDPGTNLVGPDWTGNPPVETTPGKTNGGGES